MNVPNMLSIFRLIAVPALLYLAWDGRPLSFIAGLVVVLVSDVLDGFIARKFNQVSGLGAKLDSWGDFAVYLALPLCIWWLWPELVKKELPFLIVIVMSYLVPVTIGFVKYRDLTSYHTWGAKTSAVLIGGSVLLLIMGGPAWPLHIATSVFALVAIEEIAITVILPKPYSNVRSFWHAKRLVQLSFESMPEKSRR